MHARARAKFLAAAAGLSSEKLGVAAASADAIQRIVIRYGGWQRVLAPPEESVQSNMLHGLIDPIALSGKAVPQREWLVQDIFPMKNVSMVSGDGGTGKTLLTQQLLVSAVTGRSWLEEQVTMVPALGVFCEDDKDEIHRRLSDITQGMKISMSELSRLRLFSRVDLDSVLMTFDNGEVGQTTHFFQELKDEALSLGARLVVLDSLHDLFAGNENIRGQARQFVAALRRLAIECNAAVIVNAHPSMSGLENGRGTSGSTAWNNALRSRVYLMRPTKREGEDLDIRILRTMKSNYARIGGEIKLRWQDGILTRVDINQSATSRSEEERLFLICLDKTVQQGRDVSAAANSPRYAPKVFANMSAARNTPPGAFRRAMESLFDQGKIENATIRGTDRHIQKCLRRAARP